MHRCLSCPALVARGARCVRCRLAHERGRDRVRGPRRDAALHARWARAVKARDGGRCRVRGCQTPTDRVAAHHVRRLADGGDYSLANGLVLCHAHHAAIHRGLRPPGGDHGE